ncbi:hypothetical protein PR048_025148 [Dryococelus australis]|uniref:Uncharacterized protein n=1 Tax=Dryococelus australis TaxID=614101 RepID=A0ABQ9GQJ0_9NEOP|nr:hypothetical protein PR048_025148 [Dryococelus australis]
MASHPTVGLTYFHSWDVCHCFGWAHFAVHDSSGVHLRACANTIIGIPKPESYSQRNTETWVFGRIHCAIVKELQREASVEQPELCTVEYSLRLACSLPAKANRAQSPDGSIPDFRKWESCRTMPLVGGFFSGIFHFSCLHFRRCSILTSFNPHRLSRPLSLKRSRRDQIQDFSMWETLWLLPLTTEFSRGIPAFPTTAFLRCSILTFASIADEAEAKIGIQLEDLKRSSLWTLENFHCSQVQTGKLASGSAQFPIRAPSFCSRAVSAGRREFAKLVAPSLPHARRSGFTMRFLCEAACRCRRATCHRRTSQINPLSQKPEEVGLENTSLYAAVDFHVLETPDDKLDHGFPESARLNVTFPRPELLSDIRSDISFLSGCRDSYR